VLYSYIMYSEYSEYGVKESEYSIGCVLRVIVFPVCLSVCLSVGGQQFVYPEHLLNKTIERGGLRKPRSTYISKNPSMTVSATITLEFGVDTKKIAFSIQYLIHADMHSSRQLDENMHHCRHEAPA
jgi:hypothetical protein